MHVCVCNKRDSHPKNRESEGVCACECVLVCVHRIPALLPTHTITPLQVNWGCNFLVGIGFPFVNEWLGKSCFVPFAVVLALTLLFTAFYLPETLGRTVQVISCPRPGPNERRHRLNDVSHSP